MLYGRGCVFHEKRSAALMSFIRLQWGMRPFSAESTYKFHRMTSLKFLDCGREIRMLIKAKKHSPSSHFLGTRSCAADGEGTRSAGGAAGSRLSPEGGRKVFEFTFCQRRNQQAAWQPIDSTAFRCSSSRRRCKCTGRWYNCMRGTRNMCRYRPFRPLCRGAPWGSTPYAPA